MSKITGCKVLSPSTVQAGTGSWKLHLQVRLENNDIVEHTVRYQILINGQTYMNRTVKVLPGGSLSAKVDKPTISMPDPLTDSRIPDAGTFSIGTTIAADTSAASNLPNPLAGLSPRSDVSLGKSLGAHATRALSGAARVPAAREIVHTDVNVVA